MLAVDWYDGGNPDGSTPNPLGWVGDLAEGFTLGSTAGGPVLGAAAGLASLILDANISANNGTREGASLGDSVAAALVQSGVSPNQLMLIGHSNGAGFMASLAARVYAAYSAKTGATGDAAKVADLVSLDAPVETASYWAVKAAAPVVERIDNYYEPVVQSTATSLSGFVKDEVTGQPAISVPFGFGASMWSGAGKITNFELSHSLLDSGVIGHSDVPIQYATSAHAGAPWGFGASEFETQQPPVQDGGLWRETPDGRFERLTFVLDAASLEEGAATLTEGAERAATAGRRTIQYAADGAILLGDAVAGTATQVYRLGADGAVEITSEVVDAGSVVKKSIDSVGQSLYDAAVATGGFVSQGFNSVVDTVTGTAGSIFSWIIGTAHSPVLASVDVSLPPGAQFVDFDLTAQDPGNSDVLLVAIDNTVIGQADLTSVNLVGTTHFEFWIGILDDTASHAVAFYMPSDAPSTARFTVSNVQFSGLASGTISGSAFADLNHNGSDDPGEPPLSGVTIFLDSNGNGTLDPGEISTTTDDGGNYIFRGLPPGVYEVAEALPAGFARTTPLRAGATVTITGNDARTGGVSAGPVFGDVQISTVAMNFAYLLTLAQHYNEPGTFASGDLNGDDTVNFADLLLLAQNYGHAFPAAAATPLMQAGGADDLGGLLRSRHRPLRG